MITSALDAALKAIVVNKVNPEHVESLQKHVGQLDMDGDELLPIDQQAPRLPRYTLADC